MRLAFCRMRGPRRPYGWSGLPACFIIDLTTFQEIPADVLGDAINFDMNTSFNWLIADFANPVSYDTSNPFANYFTIDDTGFANDLNGTFSVALGNTISGGDNTQVYLTYTAIPEPGAALLGSLGILLILRRRR